MEEEKELYQVTDKDSNKTIAILWNKLPEELIKKIKPSHMHNVLSYTEDEGVVLRTVIYFKKVDKFSKRCTQIELDKLVFGV